MVLTSVTEAVRPMARPVRVVWMVWPAVYTVWRSFFSDRGGEFVGIDNYERMFSDDTIFLFLSDMLAGGSQMARIESVEGTLYRVAGELGARVADEPLQAGPLAGPGPLHAMHAAGALDSLLARHTPVIGLVVFFALWETFVRAMAKRKQ